jgi:hypothetical protein
VLQEGDLLMSRGRKETHISMLSFLLPKLMGTFSAADHRPLNKKTKKKRKNSVAFSQKAKNTD